MLNFLLTNKHLIIFSFIIAVLKLKEAKIRMKKGMFIFLAIWFFIIFATLLLYCIFNWQEVIIFKPFSGNSAMLCMLIIWTFIPFLAKFKFGDFEWEINNPLYANMEQAKQNLDEAANKAQNINIDFNIQNKYNEELNTIMKKKGGKNV